MRRCILVVDDDTMNLRRTKMILEKFYDVVLAESGEAALIVLERHKVDLILLDIAMPGMDGMETFERIKAIPVNVPVIFLTASGDEYSVVTGLDLGADDYIAKPFRPRELISRIHNIMRRYGKSNALLEYRNLTVDVNRGAVLKDGQEILLSALEYRLLLYFMNNKDIVLSRSRLLDALWDMAGEFVNDNTLTVYIKRLREKIEEDPQNPLLIKTIRGMGYKMGD